MKLESIRAAIEEAISVSSDPRVIVPLTAALKEIREHQEREIMRVSASRARRKAGEATPPKHTHDAVQSGVCKYCGTDLTAGGRPEPEPAPELIYEGAVDDLDELEFIE